MGIAATDAPAPQAGSLPPQQTVLVVEDDAAFLQRVRSALHHAELEGAPLVCASGAEAVATLRGLSHPPRLALVDIGLPDISGIEVINAIRAAFPQTPIMVLSVITQERIVLDAIRAGAQGYIVKSASVEHVSSALLEVLAGNYPISPSLARFLCKQIASPPAAAPPQPSQLAPKLSPKQLELLKLIGHGLTYSEAAHAMGISIHTVQTHIKRLYRNLQITSHRQAAMIARNSGLLDEGD